jgi:hypothetical protein
MVTIWGMDVGKMYVCMDGGVIDGACILALSSEKYQREWYFGSNKCFSPCSITMGITCSRCYLKFSVGGVACQIGDIQWVSKSAFAIGPERSPTLSINQRVYAQAPSTHTQYFSLDFS